MQSYEEWLKMKTRNYCLFVASTFPCKFTADMMELLPKLDFCTLLKFYYFDIYDGFENNVDAWVALKLEKFGYPDAKETDKATLKAYGLLFIEFMQSSPDEPQENTE